MKAALFIVTQALAFPAGEDARPIPRPVTVELSNGSKIDGTLIEREDAITVLRVSGGEVRLADKTIRRIIEASPEPAASPTGDIPSSAGRVRIDLPAPGAMSFEVPDSWTETRIEGRDLGFTDPAQRLFLGISTAADQHSLWSMTPGIKKNYEKLYPGFTLGREKYAVKGRVRVWEIEFGYTKGSKPFREIQMLLDFGDTKKIFAFTTAAETFGDLSHRFRSVAESFRSDSFRPAGPAVAADAGAPEAARVPEPPRKPEPRTEASELQGKAVEDPVLDLGPLLPVPLESSPSCAEKSV